MRRPTVEPTLLLVSHSSSKPRFKGALVTLLTILALGIPATAQVPDLTNPSDPDYPTATQISQKSINLGPSGLTGWIFHEKDPNALLGDFNYTGQSRQILVSAVDVGSPGDTVGILVDDVILGVSGDGSTPVDFTSDARKSLAIAIAAAENRVTPELKLKVWRGGSTSTYTITLQNLGAYGPDAPILDAKSAIIAGNARQALLATSNSGSFGMGTLALMALDDPAHPDHAAMKAQIDAEIAALLPTGGVLPGTSKPGWQRGHTLLTLAEYYLTYGEHPSGGVFEAIEVYVDSITAGQSIFGTFGHIFADFRWPDGDTTPMMGGYGAINSSAVPGLYGLLLAKQCGVSDAALDESIDRGVTFYGSYAGRGVIPYGEHEPSASEFTSNGKSGVAALVFDLATGKEEESKYFAKMSAAGFREYETGHTGCFFQNLWTPLGAAHGGDDAIKSYFAETSWLYDLARKWDGSFAYNHIYTHDNYSGFNSTMPYIMTYALPLKRLHMTGRGRAATGVLTATDRAEAVASGAYDETIRSKTELIADLSDWSAVVHTRASSALAGMALTSTDIDTLHALASDPVGTSREGALMALEQIADPASASILSAILSDPDPHIRRLAAKALVANPAKDGELNTVLAATAAASRATFPMDTRDPLHHDLYRMGSLLFSSSGILGTPTSGPDLTGVDRGLLYPAVEAIAGCPAGIGRSSLAGLLDNLDQTDVEALGETVVNTAFYRSPADPMFADNARESSMDVLVRFGYSEVAQIAERSIRADYTSNANRALYGEMFIDLQQFAGTNTLVTPDPEIVKLCQDYIADHASLTNAVEAQVLLDVIQQDEAPVAPAYLKQFNWVVSDAAELTLPANSTQLHASVTDHVNGALTYTWRKVYGAGNVAFSENGTATSKEPTITFDHTPGNYLFEVAVVDDLGLSEITETVAVTLYEVGGTLPSNLPPTADAQGVTVAPATPTAITLTGNDPESAPLLFAVTSLPIYGTLYGTAPNLTYTSDVTYHSGTDSFTFEVTDSFGQTSGEVTVTITVDSSQLETLVYEPFNYPAGTFLAGAAGGTGMTGAWADGASGVGMAYIYDETGKAGGQPDWDGVMDDYAMQPVGGSRYVAGDDNNAEFEAYRPLAQTAAEMAGPDNELWMSAVWHFPFINYGAHVGLALTTDSFKDRAKQLDTSGSYGSGAGDGIGVGRSAITGSGILTPMFFDGGAIAAETEGQSLSANDMLVVLKFEFGATDTVTAYAFHEGVPVDLGVFDRYATSTTHTIDETTLNMLTFSQNREMNAVDEIRIGSSFAAVAGLADSPVDVTPPTPDPMTFVVVPTANATSITMTATTANDSSGVEYYFTCLTPGGNDSGWQDSPIYTDVALATSTEYTYTVTARDKSSNWNTTAPSAPASATTAGDVAMVYEPFDYAVGELAGLNGGNGFASGWSSSSGTIFDGYVRDETTNVFFDNTTLDWDGVINNGFSTSPSSGSRYLASDASGNSGVDVKRTLASSAGAMAGQDGVLWMSAVYHYANTSSGAGINFGLTDGGHLTDRGRRTSSANMDFAGVSAWNGSSSWSSSLNPTIIDTTTAANYIWDQFAWTSGGVNVGSPTVDKIIVLKYTFGASDTVEAFWFDENTSMGSITEAAFDAGKVGATYVAGIDENNLNTIIYSQGRFNNAVDEFRIGNSFNEVIGLTGGGGDADPPTLASSDIVDDQGGANVLEGAVVVYDLTFSEDMEASTVDSTDFSNAGTAPVTIGTIVQVSPSIYQVRANALGTGTLQLQVDAGAVLTDEAGNQLDTSVAILDDTTISVNAANTAPAWNSDPVDELDATEDAAYSSSLADNATDGESDPLEYAKVSGASWLSVATDGTLSGTPTNADVGANVFTVSVTDNLSTPVEATLNITVVNTNDAPVFTADPIVGSDATEDSAYVGTINGSATDVDVGDSLTYAKVSGPAWLSVATNGTLSGTPTNADVGANAFTVSVTDGVIVTPVEATLNITVVNTNDAPVFTVDPITGSDATEDVACAGTINGSATDEDVGDTLTYAKVSGPAWLSVATDGTLSGTPENADVGANAFTVSVDDGNGGSDTATLNITVLNTNDAPVFAADPLATAGANEDVAYGDTLAESASDDDGDSLVYAKVSGPAWLSVGTDGTLSGTPSNADLGLNTFTVSVSDSIAPAVQATLEITVNPLGSITWQVFDISGDVTDVSTEGTLVQAHGGADFGTGDVVDGATFDINGVTFDDGFVFDSPSHLDTIGSRGGSYPAPNAAYATLCKFADRQSSGTATFTFSGLTIGNTYQIQLWHADNVSTAMENGLVLNDGGTVITPTPGTSGHATLLREISEGGYGQYAVGTFVAVSSTQQFLARAYGNLTSTPTGQSNITINGCQLRLIASGSSNNAPVWTSDPVNEIDATEDSAYASSLADDATDADTGDTLTFAKVSGPAWLSVATDGTLSGTPDNSDVGANVFTVSVTDGVIATPIEATLNITVINTNDAPTFTVDPITGADATEDSAYSGTIAGSATDDDAGATLTYAKVSGPTWLNIATDGTLSGTPENSDVGANSFTVSVTDSIAAPVNATLNIAVLNTNDAPVFTADPIAGSDATEDAAYGGTIAGSATDVDAGATLTYAKVSGPVWLSVASDGALSGTPSNADVGANAFTVSVTDSIAAPVQATLNIDVINTNDAPVASNDSVTTDEDTGVAITLSAADIDGPSLTYAVVSGPTNGSLSGTAPNLTYTPDGDYNGADSFTFKANDTLVDSNTATISITVNPVDDEPVADDQSVATDEDTALAVTLTATDADEDTLNYSVESGPSNGVLTGTAPNLTYTPNGDYSGSDSFTFKATGNAVDSNIATISITVNAVNDAPVASNDSVTTDEDTDVAITLVATDIDGTIQSYTIVDVPSNGILTGTAPNLTYSPNSNYNGPDSFTFTANDGTDDSNVATVDITVTAVNDAPVFTVDPIDGSDATVDTPYSGTIAGSATDVDAGASLTYALESAPTWLSVASNGALSGTPSSAHVGSNVFTVSVTDGIAAPVTATLNIEVIGGIVEDYAYAEVLITGTVSGGIADTFDSNDTYEAITEDEINGKPSNRYSYLEHKWEFNVAGGDTVSFHVEAHHSANGEGDDFIFAYSTTGVNGTYTDMLTVTKTSDDDTEQSFTLPGGTSGVVHVRVLDTDQTPGNRNFDTISIDQMYFLSEPSAP